MSWNIVVILAAFVLIAFLVWKEFTRENKSRLVLRIICSILAVASLIMLAIPVSIPVSIPGSAKNSIVLLSDGFSRDSLSKFKQVPLFTTDAELLKKNPAIKIQYVPDLVTYLKEAPVSKIHILGYGLRPGELASLTGKSISFHPSVIPPGIVSLSKTEALKPGETLNVSGSLTNTGSKPFKVVLKGLNTTLDSVVVPVGSPPSFSVSTVPRHLGKAVYSIQLFSGGELLEEEKIPVEVLDAIPVKILMLAASPGFESKFLKNWLYEHSYAIALRTAISKGKFSKEYLNLPKANLDILTPSLLQNFDLVLADAAQLNTLGSAEAKALENMVNKGMGLLIRNDSIQKPASSFLKIFGTYKIEADSQKSISINLSKENVIKLKTDDASFIKSRAGNQPLLNDINGRILVNSKLYGNGKVILSTLPDTYSLSLSGNLDDYSSIWSRILEKAAKKSPAGKQLSSNDKFPLSGEPLQLTFEDLAGTMPSINSINPEQDQLYPSKWNVTYYSSKPGWNLIEQGSKKPFTWYVHEKNSWKALKAAEKVSRTNYYLENSIKIRSEETEKSEKGQLPLPEIYIMLLFVACCGYLWLETKLL